jgi:hypothetical protein
MAQITTYFTSSSNALAIDGLGEVDQVAYFIGPSTISSNSNMAWSPDHRSLSLNGPETRESTLVIAGNSGTDATSAIDVRTSLNYGDITVFKVYDNGRIDSQVLSGTGSGGQENLAIGVDAGGGITTGTQNTLLGYLAGRDLTSSTRTTIVGRGAGRGITSSPGNTLIGNDAGAAIVTGSGNNTLVGDKSGVAISTGVYNSCLGVEALGSASIGNDNVSVGYFAGRYRGGGSGQSVNPTDSIYIGSGARSGSAAGSVSNEIVIGKGTVGNGQGTTTIGNSFCTDCFVFGNVQPTGSVYVADGKDIVFDVTNGTRIGTSASQKLAFWNKTPIAQPTTSIPGITVDHIAGGTNIKTSDKFDNYTLGQVVAALRAVGILA